MVLVTLHGDLGKQMKRESWNLDVKSVSEGVHAINCISKNKLYKYLYEKNKGQTQYQVLINKRPFFTERPLTENNLEDIKNSELVMNVRDLRSIDIVPVIAGSKDVIAIVLGVVLIIVGVVLSYFGGTALIPYGAALIVGGIGLVAAGIINLLSSPPKFEDFREIDGSTGRTSYLFNGPENTTREGGPVPVGYGNLIVGSQVISASYVIDYVNADGDSADGAPTDENGLRFESTIYYTDASSNGFGLHIPIYKELGAGGKYFVFISGPSIIYPQLANTTWHTFRSYSNDGTTNGNFFRPIGGFGNPLVTYPNLPFDSSIATSKKLWLSTWGNVNPLLLANAYFTREYNPADPNTTLSTFVLVVEDRISNGRNGLFYLIPNSYDLRVPGLFDNPRGNYAPIPKNG